MKNTWIVIADSARARIFALVEHGAKLEPIKELLHAESRAQERDLITDRPGRGFDREGPGRHAMSPSVSPKAHEASKFCKELADELETARKRERCDRLVLVAAPAFLGQLRKSLSNHTSQLVSQALDKNLVHMDAAEILAHLPEAIRE